MSTESVAPPMYGTRDDRGQLIRDPANPHGLPPRPDAEEHARRFAELVKASDTARVAAARIEEVRLANLRPDGPVELDPYWWET